MIAKIQRPLEHSPDVAEFLVYGEQRESFALIPFETIAGCACFMLFFRASKHESPRTLCDCPLKIYVELECENGSLVLDEDAPLVDDVDW